MLPETLVSDHHIIQLSVAHTRKQTKTRIARLTEWQSFRNDLDVETTIIDIEDWFKNVLKTAERYTKDIQLDVDTPAVDAHLLHLWEARRGLLKRWKRQKLNRKLRKRIFLLTEQAQDYANRLARQNWHAFCDKLQGTLSTKKTWHLLRTLLATQPSKAAQKQHLQRLIRNYAGTEEHLLEELQKKLCGDAPTRA